MTPDVRINNDIAIQIHGFETIYDRGGDGALQASDVVVYSPLGDTKTKISAEIRRVSRVLPIEECGDNLAYLMAHKLWAFIEPRYKHWQDTNTLPEAGTPLAAWPGVTAAQAAVLRTAGLKSVEEIAEASDIVMTKTGLANASQLRDHAKRFLANEAGAREAKAFATLEAENAELKSQMTELMRMMQELTSASDANEPARRRGKAKDGKESGPRESAGKDGADNSLAEAA